MRLTAVQVVSIVGVLALFGAGFGAAYSWMSGRLTSCRLDTAVQAAAVLQRDEMIRLLEAANTELAQVIERQNGQVILLAKDAQQRQETSEAALVQARKSHEVTARTIAALSARIKAGSGDCSKALSEIRAAM